jgi:hypothetical protein
MCRLRDTFQIIPRSYDCKPPRFFGRFGYGRFVDNVVYHTGRYADVGGSFLKGGEPVRFDGVRPNGWNRRNLAIGARIGRGLGPPPQAGIQPSDVAARRRSFCRAQTGIGCRSLR